jgi:hypothetical protein
MGKRKQSRTAESLAEAFIPDGWWSLHIMRNGGSVCASPLFYGFLGGWGNLRDKQKMLQGRRVGKDIIENRGEGVKTAG